MSDQQPRAARRHAFAAPGRARMAPRTPLAALAVFCALAIACGDGTGPRAPVPVGIDLDAIPGMIGLGDTLHLAPSTYVVDASNRTISDVPVVWSTSDSSVATVDGELLVAHDEGEFTLLAAAQGRSDSVRATRRVVVRIVAREILLVSRTDSLTLGDTLTLVIAALDARGRLIGGIRPRVTTSDTLVARIQGGETIQPLVRAVGDGDVTITAEVDGARRTLPLRVHLPRVAVGEHVVRRLAIGETHACAITATSEMICWGSNDAGELGRAGQPATGVAVVSGALRFTDVDAQQSTSCGVTVGGDAWCWGQYAHGTFPRTVPTLVPRSAAASAASRVRIGRSGAACVVGTSGDAECWGNNGSLLLTREPASSRDTSVLPIAGDLRWRDVDAGYDHACGVTTDGELACWGLLGRLLPGGQTAITPLRVGGALRFTQVASGVDFSCALDAQGAAYCAGIDDWGQLGRGITHGVFDLQTLAPVSGTLRFASIHAGDRFACGLTSEGAAWCWGDRARGTNRALVPTEFSRLERFASFAAGTRGACGVTATGAVRCIPTIVSPAR